MLREEEGSHHLSGNIQFTVRCKADRDGRWGKDAEESAAIVVCLSAFM